ncbi:hypothetical protein AMTRI_Chr07g79940 [Amborella trichopoda]
MKKVKPLLDLSGANERLALWKADLCEEGSFDEAINGCYGVFHIATPNEVIKPTVNGTLDILRACIKAKFVRHVIFTSSVVAIIAQDHQLSEYDESSWIDVEFCRSSKKWGWRAGLNFVEENKLEVVTVAPSVIVEPFIMQNIPESIKAHPDAKRRYICSSHDQTILQLAKMMRERYPEYDIPIGFKDCHETLEPLHLSSKKLTNLGFKFKYKVEDMLDQAIMLCREKGGVYH